MKVGSELSISPHNHFTEYLLGAFEKSPRESDLNQKPSSFFDPAAQEHNRDKILQQIKHTTSKSSKNSERKMKV
jgi:hypothetical protein